MRGPCRGNEPQPRGHGTCAAPRPARRGMGQGRTPTLRPSGGGRDDIFKQVHGLLARWPLSSVNSEQSPHGKAAQHRGRPGVAGADTDRAGPVSSPDTQAQIHTIASLGHNPHLTNLGFKDVMRSAHALFGNGSGPQLHQTRGASEETTGRKKAQKLGRYAPTNSSKSLPSAEVFVI